MNELLNVIGVLKRYLLVGVSALLASLTVPVNANTITLTTGQTGGQTQIDENHTSVWNFEVPANMTFDTVVGNFTLKKGPSTTANIVFSLWSGYDGYLNSSASLGQDFKIDTDLNQQYTAYTFTIIPDLSLSSGPYSVSLTSAAVDQQSTAYFIKGYDQVTIDPPSVSVSLVPDGGATLGLLGLGVVALVAMRRKLGAA